jgi:hypothetical protein
MFNSVENKAISVVIEYLGKQGYEVQNVSKRK